MKPQSRKEEAPKGGIQAKASNIEGLRNLFENGLKDIYYAEKAQTKSLQKMVQNASSPELVNTLKNDLAETQQNVSRLENIFKTAGLKASVKKSQNIEGLLKETEGVLNQAQKGKVLDAGIVAAGQKLKQYEITSLTNLHNYAKNLGENNVANLLATTLNEVQQTNAKLNGIASSVIKNQIPNPNAISNLKKKQ